MPQSPDIKRFSIAKQDTPPGTMRVLYSGINHTYGQGFINAAKEMKTDPSISPWQRSRIRVEQATVLASDGTKRHPRDLDYVVPDNSTVIFIQTPRGLYDELVTKAARERDKISHDLASPQTQLVTGDIFIGQKPEGVAAD